MRAGAEKRRPLSFLGVAATRLPSHRRPEDCQTVPIDAAGRAAAKGIADAQLVEYDGAPHGLFATEGERLTNDLLTFLGR